MKKFFILTLLVLSVSVFAQTEKPKIYNPEANGMEDLNEAIKKASVEDKHVLVQIGGNWCPWCVKLHHYVEEHHKIDSLIKADYVFVRVNYSKENKNMDVIQKLEYPHRFGFPVMVVLNEKGERIHTQETGSLEENKSYSEKKLERFLNNWSKKTLDKFKEE